MLFKSSVFKRAKFENHMTLYCQLQIEPLNRHLIALDELYNLEVVLTISSVQMRKKFKLQDVKRSSLELVAEVT